MLYRARDGAVWANRATGGGVVRYDGATRTTFGAAFGLPPTPVVRMHEDEVAACGWAPTAGAWSGCARPG